MEHSMTPQELKNSILQLAIQGRLVEQRPEEGTAEELYQQIQAEKQSLIKSGKIKKEKPLPEITDDEKPFDIPESWKWVRLGDTFAIEMGQSPDGNSVSEFSNGTEFHQGKVFFGDKLLKKSPQKTSMPTKIAPAYSVLLCVRAPVGKVNITDREICIGRGLCSVASIAGIPTDFVYYLLATYENIFIKQATGTTFVAITGAVVKNQAIPLPPLAEQKRIVAKIEELLPLIDRYEKAWTKFEDFNKRFPGDMQKSLLQMAIQGKLVEQRPEEGTAEELYAQIQSEKQTLIKSGKIKKEKPLPEITDDEKAFDIPESWKWVRLGTITYNFGQKTPTERFCYVDVGSIDNKHHKLNDTDSIVEAKDASSRAKKIVNFGDVIFATIRPYLQNICIIDRHFPYEPIVSTAFAVMACPDGLLNKYLFYSLLSPSFMEYANATDKAKGVAYPAIGEKDFFNGIVPLPPLAEQKRIVTKLEELLPLCERLK